MRQFVVSGSHSTLHVKLEYTNLATSLTFGIFNQGGFMIHVRISSTNYVE